MLSKFQNTLAWVATINTILLIEFRGQCTDIHPQMPGLVKSLAHPSPTKISLVLTSAIDTKSHFCVHILPLSAQCSPGATFAKLFHRNSCQETDVNSTCSNLPQQWVLRERDMMTGTSSLLECLSPSPFVFVYHPWLRSMTHLTPRCLCAK